MITQEEQIRLKNIIGAHYAEDVSDILNNKALRNRNGHPYALQHIRTVFVGMRENTDVEAAILELAAIKQAESKKVEQRKNEILTENK